MWLCVIQYDASVPNRITEHFGKNYVLLIHAAIITVIFLLLKDLVNPTRFVPAFTNKRSTKSSALHWRSKQEICMDFCQKKLQTTLKFQQKIILWVCWEPLEEFRYFVIAPPKIYDKSIPTSLFGPYHLIFLTQSHLEILFPTSPKQLVASRCDNDTTHQLRRDSGPRLRQLLIIDGNQALGLASNCITGHFSIAICESCGDVCRVAINRHCSERQRPHTPLSDCLYFFFCEGNWCKDNVSVLQAKDFTTSFKISAPVHGLF